MVKAFIVCIMVNGKRVIAAHTKEYTTNKIDLYTNMIGAIIERANQMELEPGRTGELKEIDFDGYTLQIVQAMGTPSIVGWALLGQCRNIELVRQSIMKVLAGLIDRHLDHIQNIDRYLGEAEDFII
jgi:hypothetical protein